MSIFKWNFLLSGTFKKWFLTLNAQIFLKIYMIIYHYFKLNICLTLFTWLHGLHEVLKLKPVFKNNCFKKWDGPILGCRFYVMRNLEFQVCSYFVYKLYKKKKMLHMCVCITVSVIYVFLTRTWKSKSLKNLNFKCSFTFDLSLVMWRKQTEPNPCASQTTYKAILERLSHQTLS